MELDPKIWIAIAAITAALISAIISVVNMVISKDQKTTEFRQEWINSVRLEISNITALAKSIRSQSHIIDYLESKPETKKDAIEHLSDVVKNYSKDLNNCYSKLLLFLNPKEHKNLISLIDTLVSLSNVSSKTKTGEVTRQSDLVIEESQKVLKKEWNIVKRGEITFVITKYIFIISLSIILLIFISKIGGVVDVSFVSTAP